MKKTFAILAAAAAACTMSGSFLAADIDTTDYIEGVTVTADQASPTGYTATFVYKDADAQSVQLFSQLFYFYSETEGANAKYLPEEWTSDMFSMWANDDIYTMDMEKVSDDIWTISIPLPSGGYQYQYTVDGENTPDPANLPLTNTLTGTAAHSSMVYVPFDETKQTDDQSVEMPRDGENGSIVFDTYMDGEAERNLALYLPYGYDADREEPYKVIYLAHGGGGNELDWLNEGCVPNIMDNLIAEGYAAETIVVTMDNNGIADEDAPANQMENIMPYVEANYNVSSDPQDRAYAGYSLGAKIAAEIYLAYPEEFAYIGMWSVSQDLTKMARNTDGDLDFANVMVGMGMYDSTITVYGNIPKFIQSLYQLDIDYDFYTFGGAHDFNFWQKMFTLFVKDYMNEN